jgi:hypothetical protein
MLDPRATVNGAAGAATGDEVPIILDRANENKGLQSGQTIAVKVKPQHESGGSVPSSNAPDLRIGPLAGLMN